MKKYFDMQTKKYAYKGYHGYFKRKSFHEQSEEEFRNTIIKTAEELEILNLAISNQDNFEKPLKVEVSFRKTPESIEDIISVDWNVSFSREAKELTLIINGQKTSLELE